jgi:hypothetical protein
MAQQTAVEWLAEKLIHAEPNILEWDKYIKQAKQMEKEQIMNARLSTFDLIRRYDVLMAEQYYTETYI